MIPWEEMCRDPYRDLFVAVAADLFVNDHAHTPDEAAAFALKGAATFIEALRKHDAGAQGATGAHNPGPSGASPEPDTDTDPNR